jgi:hypothetical protein
MTDISRRSFFKKTGMIAGGIAASSAIPLSIFQRIIKKFEVTPKLPYSDEIFCKWFESNINESLKGITKIYDTEMRDYPEVRGKVISSFLKIGEKEKYISIMLDSPQQTYEDLPFRNNLANQVCKTIMNVVERVAS